MDEQKNTGLVRLGRAWLNSWAGLLEAWRGEAAFRQEIILVFVLTPIAFVLGDSGVERALLVGSLLPVLVAELLNSAIEALADRFGREIHPLLGRAKDLGSAAVLLALLNVVGVWLLVLF